MFAPSTAMAMWLGFAGALHGRVAMQKSFNPPDSDADIVRALGIEAMRLQIAANYSRLLHELVFATAPQPDEKLRLSFQRTLDSGEANTVLALIWKESRHVSAEALAAISMEKAFQDGNVTAHALGVMLSDDPNQPGATVSRVRTIAVAAAAYGLIDRRSESENKVLLVATELLHGLMVRLGEENAKACDALYAGARSRWPYLPWRKPR